MSEPTEGMLYHVELDEDGDVLTIEARQNDEMVSRIEIARSALPSIARAISEVEYDHDGESHLANTSLKKRVMERIAAYEDGKRDAEPSLAILQDQVSRWSRIAERLAWYLADCHTVLRFARVGYPRSYGDNGTKALADFRAMLPEGVTMPRDFQDQEPAR